MSDIDPILQRFADWRGDDLALATVISTWGSAPRPRGSHMLLNGDGRFEGSVSGGCVEGAVIEAAGATIADGAMRRLRFGVADSAAWEIGLPCGGEIELLVQPVSESGFAPELFDRIALGRARGQAVSLTTDLETGRTRTLETAETAGFVNLYPPPRRLLIVGAVQIAQSLARLASAIGFQTAVIDPRARFLTAERFPHVELDERWPDEAIAARAPDPATAVVTLSHDIKIDDPALEAALRSPAGYIAALGSRKSHAARLERLAAAGFDADARARIEGPAGLPIGAVGASEIALSIAAGMVSRFRTADASRPHG